jgi:putative acetyltransferase
VRIRLFKPEDAQALHTIFVSAVLETGRRDYNDEQVRAWAANAADPAEYVARSLDGRVVFVATDDQDIPVAYIDLEADGHIDHLFCRPDMGRQGIGSALYEELERSAIARGIRRLHVEASEGSRPLFLRKGFILNERRDFSVDGVPTHNYAMSKILAPERTSARSSARAP